MFGFSLPDIGSRCLAFPFLFLPCLFFSSPLVAPCLFLSRGLCVSPSAQLAVLDSGCLALLLSHMGALPMSPDAPPSLREALANVTLMIRMICESEGGRERMQSDKGKERARRGGGKHDCKACMCVCLSVCLSVFCPALPCPLLSTEFASLCFSLLRSLFSSHDCTLQSFALAAYSSLALDAELCQKAIDSIDFVNVFERFFLDGDPDYRCYATTLLAKSYEYKIVTKVGGGMRKRKRREEKRRNEMKESTGGRLIVRSFFGHSPLARLSSLPSFLPSSPGTPPAARDSPQPEAYAAPAAAAGAAGVALRLG